MTTILQETVIDKSVGQIFWSSVHEGQKCLLSLISHGENTVYIR